MIPVFRYVNVVRGTVDTETMSRIALEDVHRALALENFDPEAAQLRMAPRPRPIRRPDRSGQPRLAGVLVLLYPLNDELTFALMRRPEYEGVHSGQISLPGGKKEGEESLTRTALRETCEELGVCDPIDIIGSLHSLYIPPSDFEVHPSVGYLDDRPAWHADPSEVAEIIETPLSILLDDSIKGEEEVYRPDVNMTLRIFFYSIQGHKVWGATAAILAELESRLQRALGLTTSNA
ncbi:MAG: CoA pyrophosphatase [Anaerolineae bacterium]|nr:CoA pyrophosphatase [Anaerolineae bacterium]